MGEEMYVEQKTENLAYEHTMYIKMLVNKQVILD
jgi:hypothetical protein